MQFSNEKNSNTLGICKKKKRKKKGISVSLSHRCGDDLEAKLAGMFQISPCVLKLQGIN